MFNFLKKNQQKTEPLSWSQRLRQGLSKTRSQFSTGLSRLILGKKTIDPELMEAIETQLLLSDLGYATTQAVLAELTAAVDRKQLTDPAALLTALQQQLTALLAPVAQPLIITKQATPFVILTIGVNGAGKTTTIGKLTQHLQAQGLSVMIAAADTFRAAAVDQLKSWGKRNNTPVISQTPGADSAAVAFDALTAATNKQSDVLIIDTAGRLHNKAHLMDELKKISRVLKKINTDAPHETMLVLDTSTGQNALSQAKLFHEAMHVTGLTLTKLDGTAKGGAIFAIAKTLGIPIRFIGIGEQLEDLHPFEAEPFIDALFTQDS